MKKKLLFAGFLLSAGLSFSQLCQPTFVNGCFSWNTKSIDLNTIHWTFDEVDCTISDLTSNTTELTAGTPYGMSISSGNWCGCSVWIDFNKDNTLDNSENIFYQGNGSTEVEIFDLTVNIPTSTINGNYTMRVLTSWGSDGFTVGANGYGGCGDYQYGNFQDITITVVGGQNPASLASLEQNVLALSPNPVNEVLTVENKQQSEMSYSIYSAEGTLLLSGKTMNDISVENLSTGVYFIRMNEAELTQKFIKL